jgi:hypothetical protein
MGQWTISSLAMAVSKIHQLLRFPSSVTIYMLDPASTPFSHGSQLRKGNYCRSSPLSPPMRALVVYRGADPFISVFTTIAICSPSLCLQLFFRSIVWVAANYIFGPISLSFAIDITYIPSKEEPWLSSGLAARFLFIFSVGLSTSHTLSSF